MEAELREVIGEELRRRHGFGMMEGKIKPVHIANALMREEYRQVGRMSDLKYLMAATAARETADERLAAITRMLERNRERWGRLGEEDDLRRSVLATRVLPLLRTILATDNAAYGTSPEFSSFSSPTALTVTRDVSDDHAGAFVHRLWGGHGSPRRLAILDMFRELTNPEKDLSRLDDLTAILVPLSEDMVSVRGEVREFDDHDKRPVSEIGASLRDAATDLQRFEAALRPNPIASLQRIVLLASISIFVFAASRGHDWMGLPRRVVLIDCSNSRDSAVSAASERSVSRLLDDAREYMAQVLTEMLREQREDWEQDPIGAVGSLLQQRLKKHRGGVRLGAVSEIVDELRDADTDVRDEMPRRLVELFDSSSGRSLDGFLRLLGVRCGLLYPQQKNPLKRCVPMDRALEVIVAGTFDLSGQPMEYRDFLDGLYDRWRLIVGGRLDDGGLLAAAGTPVTAADLAENSERFLLRLQRLGLARKLADSVAVVGLMESAHAGN